MFQREHNIYLHFIALLHMTQVFETLPHVRLVPTFFYQVNIIAADDVRSQGVSNHDINNVEKE